MSMKIIECTVLIRTEWAGMSVLLRVNADKRWFLHSPLDGSTHRIRGINGALVLLLNFVLLGITKLMFIIVNVFESRETRAVILIIVTHGIGIVTVVILTHSVSNAKLF